MPLFTKDGDTWRCGLTIEPHRHVIGLSDKLFANEALAPLFAEALGIGRGCDADLGDPK